MGLLSSIFSKKETNKTKNLNTKEYLSFLEAEKFAIDLLDKKEYISKKKYIDKISSFQKTIEYYKV